MLSVYGNAREGNRIIFVFYWIYSESLQLFSPSPLNSMKCRISLHPKRKPQGDRPRVTLIGVAKILKVVGPQHLRIAEIGDP